MHKSSSHSSKRSLHATPIDWSVDKLLDSPDVLDSIALFQNVSPDTLALYLHDAEIWLTQAEEVLLDPKKISAYVFIVLEGEVQVHIESIDQQPLTTLSAGDCIGEMSFAENSAPSAFVRATENSVVLALPHQALWSLINVSHSIARNLLVILSQRVRVDNKVIADNHTSVSQYEHRSITDALTGLYNRHWLEEMFRREIDRCHMDGKVACLIMIDIDDFSGFNNDLGHLAGDDVLCYVASGIQSLFRPSDMAARFGGDEFCVLLPNTTLEQASIVAERLRAALENNNFNDQIKLNEGIKVTVSIGVSELERQDTLETLLQRADDALYQAKDAGRNCVRLANS